MMLWLVEEDVDAVEVIGYAKGETQFDLFQGGQFKAGLGVGERERERE